MRVCLLLLLIFVPTQSESFADDDLPIVPDGFVVDVVAREPMVSNPCVMAFDQQGRIYVAQGPQWRGPTPETPGDRIDILVDDDDDGTTDRRVTFAEGFNSIQGIAWSGGDLWIANAPDLTVVRDTDGDDQADVYIRVYTGLGNLEHSLHGLNFGPDGKLYMSKGNSKGYNRLDQLAPKVFRELWGLPSPEGAPDYTPMEVFTKDTYRRKYHTPQDDWGQQGGILRCDPYRKGELFARNLEIVSSGFRNPWDIAFDDGFNWLGTDNDQSAGDRIFMPFDGAHFGWGHPWSFSWKGQDHLPTVPVSAPTFEGSGTGVTHYHAQQFPEEYRDVFFIGDWLRREVLMLRPRWDGALMTADSGSPAVFIHADGGRTLPLSDGRVFDPTDIEVGPDGCLYVLSWGHEYGGEFAQGSQSNAGRVYRIRYRDNALQAWDRDVRSKAHRDWSLDELFFELGSHVASWRVNAQTELIRRAKPASDYLLDKLAAPESLSKSQQTWAIWTLARMRELPVDIPEGSNVSVRIQMIRALASQKKKAELPELDRLLVSFLDNDEPRLRFAAIQAMGQAGRKTHSEKLLEYLTHESDRLTFYATWNVLREMIIPQKRRELLADVEGGARLGLLLGLLADDALDANVVESLRDDQDERIATIAEQWLVKTGAADPLIRVSPDPGVYSERVAVALGTSLAGHRITYTLDGSIPNGTSPQYRGPIAIEQTSTINVAILHGNDLAGRVVKAKYRIVPAPEYMGRRFIHDITTPSGRHYAMEYRGLSEGTRVYTDRQYAVTKVPKELAHAAFLKVANNDDRSSGDRWLSLTSDVDTDVLVGVDTRNNSPLAWMEIGERHGFVDTGLIVKTNDVDFHFYRKHHAAGPIILGGNTNAPSDSGRGSYIVVFDRKLMTPPNEAATQTQVLAAMQNADPQRGQELFTHSRGAGCVKCHAMSGTGKLLAPDLSDLGNRAKTPEVIIASILDPSAVITEGFAQQQILTIDGKVISGAVIEETQRSLKVVGTDGVLKTIDTADIEERVGTRVSPMPAGFDKMMNPQQISDIVAWLMTQKVVGDRQGFSFRDSDSSIDIHFGQQRIATYLKEHPQLTRRALVNVTTPGGIPVTRNFPPRKPEDIDPGYNAEDGIIHPIMHPGIWIGFGDINGNDYWRLQAKVVFDGFTEPLKGDRHSGSFAVRNRYMSEDGERVACDEITRYHFTRVPEGLRLKIDAEYRSEDHDFYFGDQEESGLAIRVASPIRVQGGNGTIVNDRGEKNAVDVWGKEAKWFDYSGTIDGRKVGILVTPSPNNARPSWLHARDYGVVVTNPFPKQPKERREPYVKTKVKQGDVFQLSYELLVHETVVVRK